MKKKQLLWQIPFLLFLIVGTFFIIKQQRNIPYQRIQGFVFGTTYHISYQGEDNYQKEIDSVLNKVDFSLSPFNRKSIITKINENSSMETDEMFRKVFLLSQSISKETEGAFDITVAPLVNAWGFGFKQGSAPNAQTVDSLRQIIGYEKVSLINGKFKKANPKIMLDCGAVAKGYGVDVVAQFLGQRGIKNFMIEIGGEVITQGMNSRHKPWQIGVTKPTEDSLNAAGEIQTILQITNKAMATSGNYRNFYYKGGKKYAHTIDPKTGYPVQHSLLSATVIADNCATADAYATAFMVIGLERTKHFLSKKPNLMAYLIYSDKNGKNAVWFSPKMKELIIE